MVDSFKNNFFLFPALLLASLLYCKVIPVQTTKPYRSLVECQNAAAFEGQIVKSPVAGQSRSKKCKITLSLSQVWDKNGLTAKAQGLADVYIPQELYEACQPGKLYTAWRGKKAGFLLDNGAIVRLSARESRFQKPGEKHAFESDQVFSCAYKSGLWGRLQEIRALSRLHFTRLMYAWGSAGGLLLALLSGSRAYLPQDAQDSFRLAGLSHVLALSGMHLSLIGGLAFALGKKSAGKKFALFLQFFCILAFVWFAGKSPSLFRALLCSLFAFFSGTFKIRLKSPLNSLALVFVVHAALFPEDIFELSFMLSYGALFGILAFNEFVAKRLLTALPNGAGASLSSSIGAQLATAPISLKFFGLVAPAGILSSAAISPLVTIFVYLGLFFVLISLVFPFLAPFCGGLLGLLYKAISQGVIFFAKIPCVKI